MSRSGATWRDEYELLCERCGYSIEGLPRETNCPECGKPVVESHPEARPGTAWQRGPGVRSWFATVVSCVRSPRAAARLFRMESERSLRLRRVNIFLAAALLTVLPAAMYGVQAARAEAPYALSELTWPWAETPLRWVGLAGTLLGCWALAGLTLTTLTGIETWGIRTFGRLHGKRITPTVARTITAHATVGWVVAAALVSAGFFVALLAHEYAMHRNLGLCRGTLVLAPIWMPTTLGLLGLLAFETIVYVGVLNCPYANRARAELPPAPSLPSL